MPAPIQAVVAVWIKEVQAERGKLERELRGNGPAPVWSPEDIRRLVDSLGDVRRVLRRAEPQKKADLYESLGPGLTYEPDLRKVRVEADLTRGDKVRVGGASSYRRTVQGPTDKLKAPAQRVL